MNLKLKVVAVFDSQAAKTYMNGQVRSGDPCRNCDNHSQISNAIAGLPRFQTAAELVEAFEVAR